MGYALYALSKSELKKSIILGYSVKTTKDYAH